MYFALQLQYDNSSAVKILWGTTRTPAKGTKVLRNTTGLQQLLKLVLLCLHGQLVNWATDCYQQVQMIH